MLGYFMADVRLRILSSASLGKRTTVYARNELEWLGRTGRDAHLHQQRKLQRQRYSRFRWLWL